MKTGISMRAEHNAMHLNGVLRNMLDDIRKDDRDSHEKPPEKVRRGHKPKIGTDAGSYFSQPTRPLRMA